MADTQMYSVEYIHNDFLKIRTYWVIYSHAEHNLMYMYIKKHDMTSFLSHDRQVIAVM